MIGDQYWFVYNDN